VKGKERKRDKIIMILLKFKVDLSVNPKKVENEYGLPDINAVMNNDNLCYN